MNKLITGIVCLTCLIGCDSSNLNTLESRLLVASNDISAITASSPSQTIQVGVPRQLTLTGTIGDDEAVVTSSADWSSSDTTTIVVNSAGIVTGVADGSATITATLGPLSSAIELNASSAVISGINVSIDETVTDATIDECTTVSFTATGDFSDGGSDISISDIVEWSVSAGNIGEIESSEAGAVLRSNSAGVGTISATLDGITGSFDLIVNDNVGMIEITSDGSTLSPDNAVQYTATASFADNTNTVDITDNATWSLNANFADVETDLPDRGLVTATSNGTADLIAICGGQTASLTISSGSATEIETLFFDPPTNSTATFSGSEQETLQIEAFVRFENGTELNVTEESDWIVISNTSAMNSISNIDGTRGLVTIREPGILVVEARFQDDSDGLQTFSQRFTVTRNAPGMP